ncbi:YlxR family protein [Microbacteriaceae bacterium VKM Ac-2855]|nr:YlxR family protein [Microbacteriaceae bacterium VKM Ac-2855]
MDPVRTCIGCRLRAPRASLLRLVSPLNEVVVDPRAVMVGRGAWLHDSHECYELAVKRRAFGRAFRSREALNTHPVEQYVTRDLTSSIPHPEEAMKREQAERPVN